MTMRVKIKNEGPEMYTLKGTLIDRPSNGGVPVEERHPGGVYTDELVHSETFELKMGEEKEVHVHSLRDLLIEEKQ